MLKAISFFILFSSFCVCRAQIFQDSCFLYAYHLSIKGDFTINSELCSLRNYQHNPMVRYIYQRVIDTVESALRNNSLKENAHLTIPLANTWTAWDTVCWRQIQEAKLALDSFVVDKSRIEISFKRGKHTALFEPYNINYNYNKHLPDYGDKYFYYWSYEFDTLPLFHFFIRTIDGNGGRLIIKVKQGMGVPKPSSVAVKDGYNCINLGPIVRENSPYINLYGIRLFFEPNYIKECPRSFMFWGHDIWGMLEFYEPPITKNTRWHFWVNDKNPN